VSETTRSAATTSTPKVKGVAFRSVLAALEELRGRAVVERVLGRLSADDRSSIEFRVVNTGWYPIELYRALFAAIVVEAGEGEAIVRAIGAAAVRRDVTGVYRLMFKILSPESVLSLASKLFGFYYDTGAVTIVERRARYARSEYKGCRGFGEHMWIELLGSSEEMLRIGGATNVRGRIVRGGRGPRVDVRDRSELGLSASRAAVSPWRARVGLRARR
jgi:hypothetical protein